MGERVTPFGPPLVWSLSLIKKNGWIRVTLWISGTAKPCKNLTVISRKQQQIDRLTLCPEVFFLSSVENFLSQSSFPGSFLSDVCVQDEELSPCLLNLSVKRFPFCGLSPQFNWAIGGWQKKTYPPPPKKESRTFCSDQNPGCCFSVYKKRGEYTAQFT